jgi:polyferredoxin
MASSPRTPLSIWLRRATQLAFFAVFVWLFLETAFHPINRAGRGVTFFFDIDPLILLSVWFSAFAVPAALLLSLVTVAVTLFFGRLFCGWICPFGAVHTFFAAFRSGKAKQKLLVGGYSRWQRAKYLALAVFLGAALLGTNAVGWLDPFSFLYRSFATAIYPATNLALQDSFKWLYDANPGVGPVRVTAVSEPVYDVLRRHVLPQEKPFFVGGLLIGVLFVLVAALNLVRERFWCRYICPLGALLGIVGKNPLLRVTRAAESCNECRLCRADCHGGANPDSDWRPTECLYCWNCVRACPSQAIHMRLTLPQHPEPRE